MSEGRGRHASRASVALYDDVSVDPDDVTDQELATERAQHDSIRRVSAVLRRTNANANRSKYKTARASRGEIWNQMAAAQREIKVHIRDTELLTRPKWEEIVKKKTTHLVIEDDDGNMRILPSDVLEVTSLRSLTLMWTKIKALPEYLFKMSLTELSVKKCPLAGIKGLHQMKQLTSLELSNDGLKAIPAEFCELAALTVLNLSGNSIKSLPMSIGNLRKLKTLTVSSNSLGLLPLSITGLVSLETLDASHNQLDELPELIGNLTNLTTLRLTHNRIAELPASFRQLHRLKFLFMSNNNFKVIPASLSRLPELQTVNFISNSVGVIEAPMPQIVTLLLDKNDMVDIPREVFGCKKLEQLSLQNNQIRSISRDVSKLTTLRSLNLTGNDLDELPNEICKLDSLRHLVLRKNDITELPLNFDSLTKLTMIDVEDTKVEYQVIYELKHNGIAGLLEHMRMARERKQAEAGDANSDRGSSIFDEEDESASDLEQDQLESRGSGEVGKEKDGTITRDSGYTDDNNHDASRREIKSQMPPGLAVSHNQIAEAASKLKQTKTSTSSLKGESIEMISPPPRSPSVSSVGSRSSLKKKTPPPPPGRQSSMKARPSPQVAPKPSEAAIRRSSSQTSTTSNSSDTKPKPPSTKPKPKLGAKPSNAPSS